MQHIRIQKIKHAAVALVTASVLLATSIPAAGFTVSADDTWGGGNGTTATPYLIGTAAQLQYLEKTVNSGNSNFADDVHFKLTADIDLSGIDWAPIGIEDGSGKSWFHGDFNGDGHTVSNVSVTANDAEDVGFFGIANDSSSIENLNVVNITVNTQSTGKVGGLIGDNYGAAVKNCTVTGSVTALQGLEVGGFIGSNSEKVTNSSANMNVTGGGLGSNSPQVGGFVGSNSSELTGCYADGTVTARDVDNTNVGGLVGHGDGCTLAQDYSDSTVTGGNYCSAGGLVGYGTSVQLHNCYATGNVMAGNGNANNRAFAGGLVGYLESSGLDIAIANCYALGDVKAGINTDVGGIVGESWCSIINNVYADGSTECGSAWDEANDYIGGVAGENISNDSDPGLPAQFVNCYWNTSVTQTLRGSPRTITDKTGVGNNTGKGTPTAMSQSDMTNKTFASTLSTNTTLLGWGFASYINKSFPVIKGVGVGNLPPPVFGTFNFSTTAPTNGSVTVTVNVTGGTVTTLTHTFTANGSYTFVSANALDIQSSKVITVSNIDKTAPSIVVKNMKGQKVSNKAKVSKGAIITVKDANLLSNSLKMNGKTIKWPAGGKVSKKGSYIVTAFDKAGNKSSFSFSVV